MYEWVMKIIQRAVMHRIQDANRHKTPKRRSQLCLKTHTQTLYSTVTQARDPFVGHGNIFMGPLTFCFLLSVRNYDFKT